MRFVSTFCVLALFAIARAETDTLAKPCDENACQLPTCRCSNARIPGGLQPRDTPQFVLFTFHNAINVNNILTYRSILFGRTNRNRCPIGATFFVPHEYTDYSLVNEIYNQGFEIGLNSISREGTQYFWKHATEETLLKEFGRQRDQIAYFANITADSIQGIRSPFLQLSGNATYKMMKKANLKYDMSWASVLHTNPGLWPYTLDYKSIQDCIMPYCPTEAIPGPWVVPLLAWTDLEGVPCITADSCYYNPESDEQGWFNLFVKNFERHYLSNRAPFGFHINEGYISTNPSFRSALIRFLDMLNNIQDVFMVNANEVVDWVQRPVPLNEYVRKPCKQWTRTICHAEACGALSAEHTEKTYYMRVCNKCPRVYPWVDNPLGQ